MLNAKATHAVAAKSSPDRVHIVIEFIVSSPWLAFEAVN
jgi:hypothetical protein